MKKFNTNILLPMLFLVALGMIVFYQYSSYKSVKQLIGSNEELVNEINYKDKFQLLQTQLATFDKLVREAIITKGAVDDADIKHEIKLIDSTIDFIDVEMPYEDVNQLSKLLDSLVDLKIDNGIDILNAYVDKGKQQAELMVYEHNKLNTNEVISKTIHDLEKLSELKVKNRVSEIDRNEKNAIWSNVMIAIGAISFLILALFYIFYKIKQQQILIHELNQSKEKERKSAKIKDEFLANMSHEIRTPLNAIIGFTSLMEREPLSEKASKFVSTIKSSGTHLMEIVNEILDIAKIEEGMIRIELNVFNMPQLLATVEQSFSERMKEKGIVFEMHYHPSDILQVEGDEYRLTQILNNLLSNALKFTSSGTIKVDIRCVSRHDNKAVLAFEISDTGIGISSEKIDKIFDRFEQGDTHITRNYGGTGLGLSIVKQLVELQHGKIEVKSESEKGSRFIVELPFGLVNEVQHSDHANVFKPASNLSTNFNVLIVEDHKINQLLLEYWLNEKGIQYTIASNGFDALKIVTNSSFDLILMDIQMPGMDGYELTTKIRQELHIETPIIAMTAHAMTNEYERCVSVGMNDYLSKPIHESSFFECLQKYLHHQPDSFIDDEYLFQLSNGNAQFKNELISQFIIQAPQELESLKEAYRQRQFDQVRTIAHNMKTTFGYLGIQPKYMNAILRLEQGNDLKNTEQDIDQVSTISFQVLNECKNLLAATE